MAIRKPVAHYPEAGIGNTNQPLEDFDTLDIGGSLGALVEDANANLIGGSTAAIAGASTNDSIAIGTGAVIPGDFANRNIAIGSNATVIDGANGAIAIGENASVDGSFDAIALGTDATVGALVAGAIAIGSGAVADHVRGFEISNHIKTGFGQTIDATPLVIYDDAMSPNEVMAFNIQAMGKETVTMDVIASHIRGAIKRDGASTIVGVNDTVTVNEAGAAGWTIVAVATGNNLQVIVTGEAAHNIDWRCNVTYEKLS